MGVGEDGPVRGDEDVARQREFKAAGDRSPLTAPITGLSIGVHGCPVGVSGSRVAGPRILGPELF